jgi:hypothetical protein
MTAGNQSQALDGGAGQHESNDGTRQTVHDQPAHESHFRRVSGSAGIGRSFEPCSNGSAPIGE